MPKADGIRYDGIAEWYDERAADPIPAVLGLRADKPRS